MNKYARLYAHSAVAVAVLSLDANWVMADLRMVSCLSRLNRGRLCLVIVVVCSSVVCVWIVAIRLVGLVMKLVNLVTIPRGALVNTS